MEVKRLFDCIDHQLQHFPKPDMLSAKVNGQWRSYSTQEVKEITDAFAAGLIELGVSGNDMSDEGRDKIAIISNNRPEWLFTDLAVQQTGAVLVPIYPTTNEKELEFISKFSKILNLAKAEAIANELEKAHYHIERNANPKILFLDVSLQFVKILKFNTLPLTSGTQHILL